MRGDLRCAAAVLAMLGLLANQRTRAASIADFEVFSLTSGAATLLPGRLYVPPEAVAGPRPLILFMHGAGESGTNNSAQVNVNINNLLAEAKQRGAYLYAPQTNAGWTSGTMTDRVRTMVDRALTEKNVDPRRVYVTGLSMGGGGTWNMLNRHGELFAAAVPICAVGPGIDYSPANLLDEPIWAFHARNDATVSVGSTRAMYNSLLGAVGEPLPSYLAPGQAVDAHYDSLSLDIHYTEYYQGGHGIWNRVYLHEPMYDWLFAQSSVPEPSVLALAAGALTAVSGRLRRRR